MPTRRVRLPGSLTGRRAPVDAGYVHWCAESCVDLSPSDRQIVVHVMHGKSNKQISDALSIPLRTVTNRLTIIMRKLGVSDRTALAVLAVKTGIE